MKKPKLTVKRLCAEAIAFAEVESTYPEPTLYGVTDGKAVGTYLEHKLRAHLEGKYTFASPNSAVGIDFSRYQCRYEGDLDHVATIFLSVQIAAAKDLRSRLLRSRLCL